MTRRRQPRRGPGGRFLPRDAQAATRTPTPSGRFCFECAAHPEMDVDKEPCYSCLEGHNRPGWDHPRFKPKGSAPLGVSTQCPAGRQCEECGTEMEERLVRIGGDVLYLVHCPRCTPDPLSVMQE